MACKEFNVLKSLLEQTQDCNHINCQIRSSASSPVHHGEMVLSGIVMLCPGLNLTSYHPHLRQAGINKTMVLMSPRLLTGLEREDNVKYYWCCHPWFLWREVA